jgi:hypothetical protein
MYMLLSSSLQNEARFHHNHWDSYSAQRQQQLLAENAALKVELTSLQGTPRDPNYAPAGTDPDLIYSEEFVNAAYNPAPVKKDSVFWPVFLSLVVVGFVSWSTWFFFFRRTRGVA